MPGNKRARADESQSDIEDYDDGTGFVVSEDDGKPKSKKSKVVKASSSAPKPSSAGKSEGGEQFWELSHGKNTRRVGISEFKGTRLVNIREFYQNASGDFLPGKKGISLSLDQYRALLQVIPDINAALAAVGENVESSAGGLEGGAAARKERAKARKTDNKEQKANIDETSDEESLEE